MNIASASATTTPAANLRGLVERVTFHNQENGFCVLRLKACNLAALCQQSHILNDAPEHQKRRAVTVRRALGDLFEGSYG